MKIFAFIIVLAPMTSFAGVWNEENDPGRFYSDYEYRFAELPLKASLPLEKMPWASSYWPRKKGSINYRWNAPNPIGFKLKSPKFDEIKSLTSKELAELSPAEKFDLAQGRYDYPLTKVVDKNAKPKAKSSEGICDGWTASAIQFREPTPIDFTNPDGIVIPFGSADIKALMSYDVSINMEQGALKNRFIGEYCGVPLGMTAGLPGCKDINPGSLHVVLANQIALKKEAFAADMDPKRATWNHPIYGFEFEIRGEKKVKEAAKGIIIHAKVMYTGDDPAPEESLKAFSWLPTTGTDAYLAEVMELDYLLELDHSGRIIGGSWLEQSKDNHPDLLWLPTRKIKFTGDFEILNLLYKPAIY